MKKLFFGLAILCLAPVMADAAEQDTVNRCGAIIRQFQQMPEGTTTVIACEFAKPLLPGLETVPRARAKGEIGA